MTRPTRRRPETEDSGFVLIMVGLLIIPIVAFTALAIDVSAWYSRATSLQRDADAASLAGVVWMPTFSTARTNATSALSANNIVAGANNDTVSIKPGTGSDSLQVCVTDTKAPQFFSVVFSGPTSLTRCATAQYNLPIPLGSPLNYFGGDSSAHPDNGRSSPIPADKSPGFWAMIEGPGTDAQQGDAYSPYCYTPGSAGNMTKDCSTQQNTQYRTDPTRISGNNSSGFWYTIDATQAAPLRVQIFDASYIGANGQLRGSGDSSDDNSPFTTQYTLYDESSTPLTLANNTTILCQLTVTTESQFHNAWTDVCPDGQNGANASGSSTDGSIAAQPGRYVLNVRTYDPNWPTDGYQHGAGLNGYAIRAVAGPQPSSCYALPYASQSFGDGCYGTSSPQPALSAYGDMGMYNNINGGSRNAATAEFYLANVGPQYAGKTLVIDLWDIGDSNGQVNVQIMAPSKTVAAGTPVATCTWTRTKIDQANGIPGALESGPNAASPCNIQTTDSSGYSAFNGRWLHIRVPLPTKYAGSCDPTVNPLTTMGSCWWRVQYISGGQTHDATTWAAHMEGNPVHLTQ